jgi:hypothetical protein
MWIRNTNLKVWEVPVPGLCAISLPVPLHSNSPFNDCKTLNFFQLFKASWTLPLNDGTYRYCFEFSRIRIPFYQRSHPELVKIEMCHDLQYDEFRVQESKKQCAIDVLTRLYNLPVPLGNWEASTIFSTFLFCFVILSRLLCFNFILTTFVVDDLC